MVRTSPEFQKLNDERIQEIVQKVGRLASASKAERRAFQVSGSREIGE